MAVQAQYPSNVLLLNRCVYLHIFYLLFLFWLLSFSKSFNGFFGYGFRNGQEGHDYSLQPQPGGFLDQTHMVFNNNIGEFSCTLFFFLFF